MPDDIREFVHERFRRPDDKLDKVIELLTGFAERLNSLERQVAGLRVDFAHLREDVASSWSIRRLERVRCHHDGCLQR